MQATNARIGELVQLLSPMFSEGGKVDVERWLPQKGAADAPSPPCAEGSGAEGSESGSVDELVARGSAGGTPSGGSAVGAELSTPPRRRRHSYGDVGQSDLGLDGRAAPRVVSSTKPPPNRPSLREVRVGAKPTSPTGLPPEFASRRPAVWGPDWVDEVVEKNLRPQTLNGFIEDLSFDTRAPHLGRDPLPANRGLLNVSAKSDDDAWDVQVASHPGRI